MRGKTHISLKPQPLWLFLFMGVDNSIAGMNDFPKAPSHLVQMPSCSGIAGQLNDPTPIWNRDVLLDDRCDHHIAVGYFSVVALKVKRARSKDIRRQRAACGSVNRLVINDRFAIEDHSQVTLV